LKPRRRQRKLPTGIFKLSYNSAAADSGAIKRMIAELYVERMEIKIK
jgi:hypothetical protein